MGGQEMIDIGELLNYACRFLLDLVILIAAVMILYGLVFKRGRS